MFCTSCGKKLADDARFCEGCGAPVTSGGEGAAKAAAAPAAGETADLSGIDTFTTGEATRPVGGAQASPDATVAMPAAAGAASGAAQAYSAQTPAAPTAQQAASAGQKSNTTTILAVIAAVCAAVLVCVLVWVFAFGGPNGNASTEEKADDTATTEETSDDSEEKDTSSGSQQTPANQVVIIEGSSSGNPGAPQSFSYAGDYLLPDSASRYYSTSEISGMSDWELYLARNEIYARHGRGFKNADLQAYFSSKSWYVQRYSPEEFDAMASPLNDYERTNANIIRELEESRNSPYL